MLAAEGRNLSGGARKHDEKFGRSVFYDARHGAADDPVGF
jgi:hypothetical protein